MSVPAPPEPAPEPGPVARRAVVADALAVLAVFVVAAVAVGMLWPQLVEPVQVSRSEMGLSSDEVGLSRRFDNDAWYSVLAGIAGLVLGVLSTAWRRAHEVATLFAVVVSAFVAAWVADRVGRAWGPGDPALTLAEAENGATALGQVAVSSGAAYLVWPIAALVGALVVLWGPTGTAPEHGRRPRPWSPRWRSRDESGVLPF